MWAIYTLDAVIIILDIWLIWYNLKRRKERRLNMQWTEIRKTEEYITAVQQIILWAATDKIQFKCRDGYLHLDAYLRELCKSSKLPPRETLRWIAGPHGWAIHQAIMLKKRKTNDSTQG